MKSIFKKNKKKQTTMKNHDWKEIARWILTVLSAILAGLGAEACVNNGALAQVTNDLTNLIAL